MNTTPTPPTDPTDPAAVDAPTLSQLMDGEWHDVDRSACVAAVCADARLKARWARWHLARDAMRGEPVLPGPASLAARISAAVAEEPAYSNVRALPGAASVRTVAPDASIPAETVPSVAPAAGAASLGPVGLGVAGFGLAAGVALATVVGLDAWRGGVDGAPAEAEARVAAAAPAATPAAVGDPVAAALRVADGFGTSLAPLALPEVDLVANTAPATTGSYWVAGDSGARRGEAERRLNAFLSQHLEHSPGAARQGMLPYSRLVGYDELPAGTPAAGR